ncbi:MAG: ABC transporter ATP-binding protein [bacterium]|nr:ABC transporter ATP-binding protein [bacterium]
MTKKADMTEQETVLEVKDLRVSFKSIAGKVQAVRGVNFTLKKGETIAIVGESGSGKSVSIKTIMGILSRNAVIEEGSILYEGHDLTKITEKEYEEIRGKKIGLVFQDPLSSLNPLMKIGHQIAEVYTQNYKIPKAEAKKRALAIMADVGIPNPELRYNQYPFQFSGGMRQRIVIAIALANDPDILICDEPTTALDVTVQAKILQLIKKIKNERGISVIFITHDLGVVANIADRVYVMYAGKIVEQGTCEEVFLDAKHPYTWALLTSIPDMKSKESLLAIPGTPPNMIHPPKGDAFAARNRYAMKIDLKEEPPMFQVSSTHYAATWLLHPYAPPCEPPKELKQRVEEMKREAGLL